MEFFIDTGDLNEIKEAWEWGIIDGVTTNPVPCGQGRNGPKNAYSKNI